MCLVLACFTQRAAAQWTVIDPSNLVQNIKSAVQSSTTASNMIKSLQESVKIYNQSKAYYDALKAVHNIIKDARKVKLTIEMVSEITDIYMSGFNRMVTDRNFTSGELAAISAGYARLLEEGGALVAELKNIVTSGNGLSLSDKERMALSQPYALLYRQGDLRLVPAQPVQRRCRPRAGALRQTLRKILVAMTPLATNFDNLHQVLRNLYQEMLPLCGDMVGIAKGVAGLGALFYVAYRVWKALASAEPIDVFPLLRPFAIGLCIIMFPTVVLGTVNAVLSPVVQGTHAILEGQTTDIAAYQKQRDDLEYEARVREGKAWLADDEVYDQQLAELGIMDLGEIISMWWERTWHGIKTWFRELVRDFFELLFNAAGLTVDTLRTFFLVVLFILGPLSFALSVYDGFQGTLTHWLSKYICVYLWLPVADLFSAVLAKIQVLMLQADIAALQDPSYIPDGSNGVYIIFLIIGIIGYFTVPTAAEWIVQAGGGSGLGGVNRASSFAAGVAGGVTGALIGKAFGRGDKSKYGESDDSGLRGDNLATKDGGGSSGGH